MDDQGFAEDLSLESLIRQGQVTHLCSGGAGLDETAVLTALCDAVGGQIYRIDPLTYVFRIGEEDLGGALAGAPPERWAEALARRLRAALRLPAEGGGLHVRSLRGEQAADEPQPPAAEALPEPDLAPGAEAAPEPEVEPELDFGPEMEEPDQPAAFAASDGLTAEDEPAEEAEPEREAVAVAPAPDVALARLDALDLRLAELNACVSGLAAQVAAQAEAGRSLERMIDELGQECRRMPERVAAGVAELPQLPPALAGALRRIEELAPDFGGQLAPVQDLLAQVRNEVAALSRRLEARPDTSAQVTVRANSLGPLHAGQGEAQRRMEAPAAAAPDPADDAETLPPHDGNAVAELPDLTSPEDAPSNSASAGAFDSDVPDPWLPDADSAFEPAGDLGRPAGLDCAPALEHAPAPSQHELLSEAGDLESEVPDADPTRGHAGDAGSREAEAEETAAHAHSSAADFSHGPDPVRRDPAVEAAPAEDPASDAGGFDSSIAQPAQDAPIVSCDQAAGAPAGEPADAAAHASASMAIPPQSGQAPAPDSQARAALTTAPGEALGAKIIDLSPPEAAGSRSADHHLRRDFGSAQGDGGATDLVSLPGAGPGMVWMLERCGVRSLADLAGAEPTDLQGRLGLIGELIDLGAWIDFAKRRTA